MSDRTASVRFRQRRLATPRWIAMVGAACVIATVSWALASAAARQPDADQPEALQRMPTTQESPRRGNADRGRRGQDRPRGPKRDPLTSAVFRTDVPDHPFNIVLVRPEERSIVVSVVSHSDVEGYVEFGADEGTLSRRTKSMKLAPGQTALFELNQLSRNTLYYYRWCYRPRDVTGDFSRSDVYSFHTPRPTGEAFTFTIQADSHLDVQVDTDVYVQTLHNALADKPDFHVDLGDTFMTDKYPRFRDAAAQYIAQRYYFGQLCHSAPLFMVLGNHDGEKGTSGRDADDIGPWSFLQRTTHFPAPVTGSGIYSGSTGIKDGVGANYYAFEWGDALIIVLDPFWSTKERIRGSGRGERKDGNGGRGEGSDERGSERGGREARDRAGPSDDEPLKPTHSSWAITLGRTQYDWLARTLETTKAGYRFVFIHHLVGGVGGPESRGGVESSTFFEWGGNNADGSAGFAEHRPGWKMPIHDLLKRHNVSAVFHGHDHLYVHSQRDGIHYQCVPQPGNPTGGTRSAAQYGYKSGEILGSPGHVRVRVTKRAAMVEFVRSTNDGVAGEGRGRAKNPREPNGAVVDNYEIAPVTEPEAVR